MLVKRFWNAFRNFAIIFSFTMNFILLAVLIAVLQQLFAIKNGIAEPLIDGLHGNFVGLDSANIRTTIVVEDTIPINFDLPVDQPIVVVLNEPVNLKAQTVFNLGEFGQIQGQVDLDLPQGMALPVQLNTTIPVQSEIPILLNVPVNIPLSETELHQPFSNLRDLLEPYVRILDNLPGGWGDVPDFVLNALAGDINLVNSTGDSENPWFGRPDINRLEGTDAATPLPTTDGTATSPESPTATELPGDQVTPAATVPLPTNDPNLVLTPTATTIPLVVPTQEAAPPSATEEPTPTPEG